MLEDATPGGRAADTQNSPGAHRTDRLSLVLPGRGTVFFQNTCAIWWRSENRPDGWMMSWHPWQSIMRGRMLFLKISKSAVTYPLVMIVMMLAVVLVLITKFMPIFEQVIRTALEPVSLGIYQKHHGVWTGPEPVRSGVYCDRCCSYCPVFLLFLYQQGKGIPQELCRTLFPDKRPLRKAGRPRVLPAVCPWP